MARRAPKAKEIKSDAPAAVGDHLPDGGALSDLRGVIGQERAVSVLSAGLASGRLHHAWVFGGPAGVGKRTAAEALAAMALDPTLGTDLMGQLSVEDGSRVGEMARHRAHPDIRLVNKELTRFADDAAVRSRKQRSIPVEILREHVIKPAAMAPVDAASGGGGLMKKAFIIDEAELIQPVGQNALLKTLEEPPEGTLIVLVTSREHRLLPTIRSRCNRVSFGALGDGAMREWLSSSGLDVPGEELDWLMGFAEGSPGRFELAATTGMYAWHRALEPMFRAVEDGGAAVELGPTMARLVDEWAAAWVKSRPLASKEAANQMALGQMLGLVASRARRSLRGGGDVEGAMGVIEAVRRAETNAAASVNLGFVFEELSGALGV